MSHRLWYENCASKWEEALPLGNGFMGAMCFGSNMVDKFQLNQDSVWYGGFRDRVNPDAAEAIPKIRQLIKDGHISEAEILANEAYAAIPDSQSHYEPLCDLFLLQEEDPGQIFGLKDGWNDRMYKLDTCEGYIRELNLDEGIHKVSYTKDDVAYTRESFISYPDRVMAIHAVGKCFSAFIDRGSYGGVFSKQNNNTIVMEGQCGPDGIRYAVAVRAIEGCKGVVGRNLKCGEDSVIIVAADTSFYHDNPLKEVTDRLDAAEKAGYALLRQRHTEDIGELMSGCVLNLKEDINNDGIPTDERIVMVRKGKDDKGLINLSFAMGRYLLICSSRPESLPANLQGIWNHMFLPPWDSKYTININTEMNYWPAEVCNLSQMHTPLFDHIMRMLPRGREVAQKMYGAEGWVAHHNTDIWGDCAPQDTLPASTYWQMGAAWLSLHVLEHYKFTLDKGFLLQYIPVVKEAVKFFEDTLIENAAEELVVSPSSSPENTYRLPNSHEQGNLCEGVMMDAQILRELIGGILELDDKFVSDIQNDSGFATEEAGILSEDERNRYRKILDRLPDFKISSDGTLQEWSEAYEEVEPGHRHISHLFALYPGTQINRNTPQLMEAARRTLENRLAFGGGHTGWSRAWIINMYARLCDSRKAEENLMLYLSQSVLDNLLDNHPPFQIDGNFGSTAGIAEMLLQSHNGEIEIFPAKPDSWDEGEVHGLRARGGITIDIVWGPGSKKEVTLLADSDCTCVLQSVGEIALKANERRTFAL